MRHHKLVESNIGWEALALQCNILFYLFASSGLALPKVLMKCLFDYFWKPISPFSKFCVNCLLRLYFVYCNICVLNVVHRACYCTCSLMTVRVPEMCFWPAQTKKNLNFLRCLHVFDLVLKYCSDLNEGNWLQLLFHFFVLMGIFALVIGLSVFNCVLGFRLKISYCSVREMFAVGIQNCFDHDWVIFEVFCWNMPRFVDLISALTKICKNWSIVILFWRHQFFSLVWGVCRSVLWKCL